MTTRRMGERARHRQAALAALTLMLLLVGCTMPDLRVSWATARAALWADDATPTPSPTVMATGTAMPTRVQTPAGTPPTATLSATPKPTATRWPTATGTSTVSMLMGASAPWVTVQAYTSTPRPAYVVATPPEGPAAATIPPRPFPGNPAPTWTPAPTVFPILPGQPTPGTPSASAGPELELLSVADYIDGATGELVVTGEVRNIGDRTLLGVTAVVNLYDAQDRFLGSGSEPLVYPSLAPDRRSPFAVAQTNRADMNYYTVEFLDGEGTIIEVRDATG